MSELYKHLFGNIRQRVRDFTYSEFSNDVDKQNLRMKLSFKSSLKSSDEDNLSSYQESLEEFINSFFSKEEYTGPCNIDLYSLVPMCFQE